jgi:hypothetical protein
MTSLIEVFTEEEGGKSVSACRQHYVGDRSHSSWNTTHTTMIHLSYPVNTKNTKNEYLT